MDRKPITRIANGRAMRVSFALILAVVMSTGALAGPDCRNWTEDLFWAEAKVPDVRRCIDEGADLQARGELEATPLHHATGYNNKEMMQLLIDAGAEVDAIAEGGMVPLHVATLSGAAETVKVLLDAGADVDAQDDAGMTPLHQAVELAALVETDALPASGALPKLFAMEAVRALLEAGADANARDMRGLTPLAIAWQHGADGTALALVEAGADFGTASDGSTLFYIGRRPWRPLHAAAELGAVDSVRILLDSGQHVDERDSAGRTPLHMAAKSGGVEVVRILLDAGANIEAKDDFGRTPFHLAAQDAQAEVVRLLIDMGADPAATMPDGSLPVDLDERNDIDRGDSILLKLYEPLSTR